MVIIVYWLDLHLPIQPVPAHGKVYLIQPYYT